MTEVLGTLGKDAVVTRYIPAGYVSVSNPACVKGC
jgi:hypothetical protein